MATTPTSPAESKAIVEIERLGFSWTLNAQFPLEDLSAERRVQVRETGHYAPRDAVGRYAVQMAQSAFPPIIVTADGWIVDGNTRIGAALLRGDKFFPAYVLGADWLGGSTKRQSELKALAATLNSQNGTPLTAREIRTQAEQLVALGWKAEQIARAIGLKATTVTAVKKEIDAATKLSKVGLDPNGALHGASLRALGSRDALTLNDTPYRELAKLSGEAGLNMTEIAALTKEVRGLGSDIEQVNKLAAVRVELGDRIRERMLTGVAKPPRSRQLRQHLGFLLNHEGNAQELIETDPKVAEMHLETIERAIKLLTVVAEMQRPK